MPGSAGLIVSLANELSTSADEAVSCSAEWTRVGDYAIAASHEAVVVPGEWKGVAREMGNPDASSSIYPIERGCDV